YQIQPFNIIMINRSMAFLLGIFFIVCSCHAEVSDPQSHGYIAIHDVIINLQPGYADVHVTYTLDDAFRLIILMFGENDVRTRLLEILAFQNATMVHMDYESADLKVYDVKPVYGDGLYWFPAHTFGTTIPNLMIKSNQSCQQFVNITTLENGVVYY
ncbi:MAG TPA: hypothetical protein VN372_11925, partial [Methanospirillum sp.]|nr:hypothetical protein [Methanospirillum sp.]